MSQRDTAKRGSFRGSFGFIMAAAGSAVGLGNIWRFPYLAARDGGGLFLLAYLILSATFGFALLSTEIAIGRKTRKSPLTAYGSLHKKSGWIGLVSCLIPALILPYYCVIGGWVVKYFTVYLTGQSLQAAGDGYFSAFITAPWEPQVFFVVFLLLCAVVVFISVDKGIERLSKTLMPALVVLVFGIAVYALTLRQETASGKIVTGLDGLRVYVTPDFSGVTFSSLFRTVMDALTQLFYSLSIAMGIMITYGSYVPDETNLSRSVGVIEIFDALVAFLAGMMIIPAVYVFMGMDGMSKGPSLMFESLPRVFAGMGAVGNIVGCVFFAMVLFAAATSGISVMEAVVSSLMDRFRWSRKKAAAFETAVTLVFGVIVCLGYNLLYFDIPLPNGTRGQLLDLLDYLTNSILMPLVALGTCLLIGWIVKPETVTAEMEKGGVKFARKAVYIFMIRFLAPLMVLFIFLSSFGIV